MSRRRPKVSNIQSGQIGEPVRIIEVEPEPVTVPEPIEAPAAPPVEVPELEPVPA